MQQREGCEPGNSTSREPAPDLTETVPCVILFSDIIPDNRITAESRNGMGEPNFGVNYDLVM
jgi:hypothetical protein